MAATETKLGELHEKVAKVLSDALDGEEMPGWTEQDAEGNDIVIPSKRMAPSAAILGVATKFLKDNEITCARSQDSALDSLATKMEAKRERRASRQDKSDAVGQAGFLAGLPN